MLDTIKVEIKDNIIAVYELKKEGYQLARVWDRNQKKNLMMQYLQVGDGIEEKKEFIGSGYVGSMCLIIDHKILIPRHLTYKVK